MTDPVVQLEGLHIEFADDVARKRRASAVANGRDHRNVNKGDPAASLSAEIRGARAEAAGKVFLNPVKWNTYTDGRFYDLPDLEGAGLSIDVKSIGERRHKLMVLHDDKEDWAYLLVDCSDHPRYRMAGWLWGREAKHPKYWQDPRGGMPAYFVPQSDLRPTQELYDELRRRETRRAARQLARPP